MKTSLTRRSHLARDNRKAAGVECPYCSAAAGQPCTVRVAFSREYVHTDREGRPLVHGSRIRLGERTWGGRGASGGEAPQP